ncbi:hypothetical protein TNCV_2953871 [Trichonephila clavipes]|nr:hypothetical protein TNCV_2953871 [Trichonephila clavipes]
MVTSKEKINVILQEELIGIGTKAPFTWAKIASALNTTTRHFAGSKCRSKICSRFRPGALEVKCGEFSYSPMMHCARDSRWLLLSNACVGQLKKVNIWGTKT